jgi:hypothetical protein
MRATGANELIDPASVASMMSSMNSWTKVTNIGCWMGATIGGIGLCMSFVGVIRWLWNDPAVADSNRAINRE